MDQQHKKRISPLYELEMEVLAEGREWMRRRYEEKLRKLADQQGRLSPPERSTDRPLPTDADSAADVRGGGGS